MFYTLFETRVLLERLAAPPPAPETTEFRPVGLSAWVTLEMDYSFSHSRDLPRLLTTG
jgi:hypothetical protein